MSSHLDPYPFLALDFPVVDRALGCFIGLAIGDAFGATMQDMPFDPLPSCEP